MFLSWFHLTRLQNFLLCNQITPVLPASVPYNLRSHALRPDMQSVTHSVTVLQWKVHLHFRPSDPPTRSEKPSDTHSRTDCIPEESDSSYC